MNKRQQAALICRVSTPQQIGLGLESQVVCLKNKAEKDGYEVPDNLIFQEQITGLDAHKKIRKSLQDLMSAVEKGIVDVVYTYELTRISRDPYNLVERVKWFSDRKIPMYIYDAELWTLDRKNKEEIEETTNYVFGAATYGKVEAKKMKQRTMRARNELAKGGWYVGHLSDGYIAKNNGKHKRIEIDNERASVIKRVFELFIGGKSTDEIAEILNNGNIPTTNKYRLLSPYFEYKDMYRKGGLEYDRNDVRWQGSQIGQILSNEWYVGVRSYNGEKYEVPRIISEEVWQKTIEIRTKRAAQFRTNREKRKHNYLLANYFFCGNCGRKMYGHTTGQNNHYFCSSYEEGKKCGLQGVCKENIEAIVCDIIKQRAIGHLISRKSDVSSEFFKLNPEKAETAKKRIKELRDLVKGEEKAVENYENRRMQLYSMMADGKDKATIEKLLAQDDSKQAEHQKKINELSLEIESAQKRLNAGQNVDKIINSIENTNDFKTLRQLIERTISRIEIYNVDKSISVIKLLYLNDKEDMFIYSYRLLKDKYITLQYAPREVVPIDIDIATKSIVISKGRIAFKGNTFVFSDDEDDKDENVKWFSQSMTIRDFVLNARKGFPFLYHYDRTLFEEDDDRKSAQIAKYKEWRKKYNNGLPTTLPYVVHDGNYEEYLAQRKHLYNRKYKIKKNKRLNAEQKEEMLEEIDKELSLLKAKVKYLCRDEAVTKYQKERKN